MKHNLLPLLERLGVPTEFPRFFPTPIEGYRRTLAKEFITQDDFAIAAMLAAAATAIGGNVSAQVSDMWRVRSNLFIATVGYKGSGKTPLTKAVMAPLLDHEDRLTRGSEARRGANLGDHDYDHDLDDDAMGGSLFSSPFEPLGLDTVGRSPTPAPEPASSAPPRVVLNDCTSAAILDQLERAPRQLLIHSDELSKLFIRAKNGSDRQTLCELADGTSFLRSRGSLGTARETPRIKDPYASLFGGFTPDLFLNTVYGSRGDDGLLDRMLLAGLPISPHAAWPTSVHDPELATAWWASVNRLLNVEQLASDAVDGKIGVGVEAAATTVFEEFTARMNAVADAINLPASQRGTVRKMLHYAARLALVHRCLRWASGEFLSHGPLGNIDQQDAEAGTEAAMFFFGRWLVWRPELTENLEAPAPLFDLESAPGDDPALQTLAAAAANSRDGIRCIEQVTRYLRRLKRPARLAKLSTRKRLSAWDAAAIRSACAWLVAQGHADWHDGQAAIQLHQIASTETVVGQSETTGAAK